MSEMVPVVEIEKIVKIRQSGKMRNYITYAESFFNDSSNDECTIKLVAMGRACTKVITIAEKLRELYPMLHQITKLSSVVMTCDAAEPSIDNYSDGDVDMEVGAEEMNKRVSQIEISLSKKLLDKKNIGYQPPKSSLSKELSASQHVVETVRNRLRR